MPLIFILAFALFVVVAVVFFGLLLASGKFVLKKGGAPGIDNINSGGNGPSMS